jgi:hypothetical protein
MTLTEQITSSSLEAERRSYRSWFALRSDAVNGPHFGWFAIWRKFYVNAHVSRVAEVDGSVLSYEFVPSARVKDRVGKALRKRNVVEEAWCGVPIAE